MFRKLISNLPFSPTLIHDVGFYAKRLRKEEATRRLTVLFVVLALVMQSLAVFSPPDSANASSEQDIVKGGVSTLDDFLLRYDHNEDDIKDILTTIGITRSEVSNATKGTIASTKNTYVLTRYGQFGASSEEATLAYQRSAGGAATRYFSPLQKVSSTHASFDGWIGHSTAIGWFGVIKSNGSIATHGLPQSVSTADASSSKLTRSIAASNLTQGAANAANNLAAANDKIAYTLKVTNGDTTSATALFSVQLSDMLEYASIIDAGGGTLDSQTNTLSWPQIQLKAGESQERTFAVQVAAQISATPAGQSNPSSYDCVMNTAYGDDLRISVDCPAIKATENIIGHLPTTGIAANIIFAIVLLSVVGYFYARTRQLREEIRIIRHNLNSGIL